MRHIIALCFFFLFFGGCENATNPVSPKPSPEPSIGNIYIGTYSNADIDWYPGTDSANSGFYGVLTLDSTELTLNEDNTFYLRLEVKGSPAMPNLRYSFIQSGTYRLDSATFHPGTDWMHLPYWTGSFVFTPIAGENWTADFDISPAPVYSIGLMARFHMPDSTSLIVFRWFRLPGTIEP